MYMELERYEEALDAYLVVLDRLPNRFNSLWGAGRSAELIGSTEKTRNYYRKLVEISAKVEPEREILSQAKMYLASH